MRADQPDPVRGRDVGKPRVSAAPGIVEQVSAGRGDSLGYLGPPGIDADHDAGMPVTDRGDEAGHPPDLLGCADFVAGAGLHAADVHDVGPRGDGPGAASSAAPNSRVAPRSKKESGVRLITAITANEPGAHSRRPSRSVRAVITAAG
jgi:hypothetical protein